MQRTKRDDVIDLLTRLVLDVQDMRKEVDRLHARLDRLKLRVRVTGAKAMPGRAKVGGARCSG